MESGRLVLKPLGHKWQERVQRAVSAVRTQLAASHPALPLHELALSEETWRDLCAYLDLIITWNKHLDLTAARDNDELVDLVLGDAVVLASFAAPAAHCVDVGSGAGAPGAGLAILRPDLALTLVEPQQKRVAFLRALVGTLSERALEVERARAQELPGAAWDVAVSRATFEPAEWLTQGAALARLEVWVLLAQASAPALAGWDCALDASYRWPLGGAPRRAVKYVPKMP